MFTKLFGSIVHSTIWREPDYVRLVWITMLALSDKKGCVWASIPGLADAARVSIDECRLAIDRLQSPDADSRTQVAEGRRLEAIDGGWWIINHEKFQKIRNMDERREQVRMAVSRHRGKKDVINVINVSHGNPEKSRNHDVSPSDQTRPDQTRSNSPPPNRTSAEREEPRGERQKIADSLETSLIAQYGPQWEPVAVLLESRKPSARAAWVKEVATLTTSYGQDVVSRACNDALAAPEPMRMPSALRSLCAGLKEFGVRQASAPTSAKNEEEELMAWAKAQDAKRLAERANP